jgi:hypothetical protein
MTKMYSAESFSAMPTHPTAFAAYSSDEGGRNFRHFQSGLSLRERPQNRDNLGGHQQSGLYESIS